MLVAAALVVIVGGRGVPTGAAPTRRPTAVVSLPSDIDTTGRDDVTAALNAFFASIPAGSTVRFPARARLRVEGTVFASGWRQVTLDGQGATLVATTDGSGTPPTRAPLRHKWPRSRMHLNLADGSDVTIRNLRIVGPNASGEYSIPLEAQAAILVTRSRNVSLEEVEVRSVFGDGVYVVGRSTGVRISDCRFERIGRQGVAVVSGLQIVVERCRMNGIGRSAIDLEPAGGPALDVRVRDSQFKDVTNFLLAAKGAGPQVGDVWIERNRVEGGRGVSAYAGVKRQVRAGFHFIDNVGIGRSEGYEGALMRFERIDGVEVRGNRQAVASGVAPVQLVNSCNEQVAGNEFRGAATDIAAEGSCTTAGLKPSTGSPGRRGATGQGGAASRQAARASSTTTSIPTVPAPGEGTVPPRPQSGDSSPSPIGSALVFLAGGFAGVAATLLWVRSRRVRVGADDMPSESDREAPS